MRTPKTHRDILRYAYAIAAMGFISTLVLLLSTYVHYADEVRARDLLQQYHVRSLMLTEEIQQDLGKLHNAFVTAPGITPPEDHLTSNRVVGIALDSIGETLNSITALQIRYADKCFAGTVRRAQDRYERMLQVHQAKIGAREGFADRASVFALTIFQLERLHSIFMEDAIHNISIAGKKRVRDLAVTVCTVFIITSVIVTRLLILLHLRLKQHVQTEKLLFAHEQQLQQAQKMDALGTLVGGIAHDFNNILTAILGQTEALLASTATEDPQYSSLLEIQQAGERAADLTCQMLAFSRNDVAELRTINPNVLVRNLEPLLRRLIREDILLVVECGEGLGTVRANTIQLEQVLLNLVLNSRDAMLRGGELAIRTSEVEITDQVAVNLKISPGAYCRISVEDEGCGMTPEIRSRVFEPFFTTKEHGKGTGLGLSMVHGIVTRSRGFILVESKVDHGSKFEIYLPRYEGKNTEGNRDAPSDDGLGLAQDRCGTILLVEDQKQVRDLVAKTLVAIGYEILSAADGSEALQICREHDESLDLILTDVIMPGISGTELVCQVRKHFPDIAVVYISGYTDESELKEVVQSGSPLLSKPFKLHELIRIVQEQLDGHGARKARKRA